MGKHKLYLLVQDFVVAELLIRQLPFSTMGTDQSIVSAASFAAHLPGEKWLSFQYLDTVSSQTFKSPSKLSDHFQQSNVILVYSNPLHITQF